MIKFQFYIRDRVEVRERVVGVVKECFSIIDNNDSHLLNLSRFDLIFSFTVRLQAKFSFSKPKIDKIRILNTNYNYKMYSNNK